ncbi:ferrous iron transport protein A [Chamaesiphon sp.]|uniref:FeoA family protein n=1 Tax=Chamaesiphon sp. TaxID=2814140 RepID=UPI0035948839
MSDFSNSQSSTYSLAAATTGDRVRIVSLNCDEANNRLMGMGFIPGVVLDVISTGTGSIVVAIQATRLGLGADMAQHIQVTKASATDREYIAIKSEKIMPTSPEPAVLRLQAAAIGSTLRVVSYDPTSRDYKRKLLAMGLTPGTELIVKRHAPLGDPIEVEVRGFRLSLRKEEAAALIVESIEGVAA